MAVEGITGTDESRNMSDECSSRGRNVVNLRTWPMCGKISKLGGGRQGNPTQNSAIGPGHQPTHANTEDSCEGGV